MTVELSALAAAKRVVVHSTVKVQALGVLRQPRVLPAVVGMVRAQGRNVPVRQLVHQSQGPLPAGGPRAQGGHATVKVIKTRRGRGQSRWRRGGRALVILVHWLHLGRGGPRELRAVRGLQRGRRWPAVVDFSGPRCCHRCPRRAARVRPPFPFPAEISVVKHLFTVWV